MLPRSAPACHALASPFRYFHSSPEVIRLVVLMYVRFPLSSRNVEDLLFERGVDICHGTVRLWWNRFGPLFAADIRNQREPNERIPPLALAPRRDVREAQWRDGLPLARRRSRGLGGIDIQRSQIMAAARWTKPVKWMVRRS